MKRIIALCALAIIACLGPPEVFAREPQAQRPPLDSKTINWDDYGTRINNDARGSSPRRASTPARDTGHGYELVVHWGGDQANDYRRSFSSLATCARARNAVMAEHELRVQQAYAELGDRLLAPPAAPFIVCVPLG